METTRNTCSDIEQLLYLREDELSRSEKVLLKNHLDNCQACSALRKNIMLSLPDMTSKTRINPLTKEAITGLVAEHIQSGNSHDQKKTDYLRIAQQIVAAACIILFMVFGYEQFTTLRKINHLENRLASIQSSDPTYRQLQDKLLIINTLFSWTDIKDWIGAKDLDIKKPDQLKNLSRLYALGPEDQRKLIRLDSALTEDFLSSVTKSRLIDNKLIREKINEYLHEVSLAAKIYLP